MTIRVGTIEELTGMGYEILVDQETRAEVLARFYDGQFIQSPSKETEHSKDRTVVTI